jgi:hypothetical protein
MPGSRSAGRAWRPGAYLAIEHLGIIVDGVVDTTSDDAQQWASAFETYAFNEQGGGTELVVELDIDQAYETFFDETWPAALQKLKGLAER